LEPADGSASILVCYARHLTGSVSTTAGETLSIDSDGGSNIDETSSAGIPEDILLASTEAIVPLAAHILRGDWTSYAILPVISVVARDNIIPLLTSVLYQRRVWGIDRPVIGITLSKTGTIGQVLMGWLEPHAQGYEDLVLIFPELLSSLLHLVFSLSQLRISLMLRIPTVQTPR
jgi:hypothetical protein